MPDKHTDDWVEFYELQDIPKRYWVAPKTYEQLVDAHRRKVVKQEVITVVKDRLWYNLFYWGVVVGLGVIICSVLQVIYP